MLLRVILSPDNVRKISVPTPSSVEELCTCLCEKLQIEKGFTIQYEDPDFNNQLCNLHDISELPPEKATLRLHWELFLTPISVHSEIDPPADEESTLSVQPSTSATSSDSTQVASLLRSEHWPSKFPIPCFSYDVELKLQKANEEYEKNGKSLTVSRDILMEVLGKLAEAIYTFKAYPKDTDLKKVASALIEKHPCLKRPGSETGCEGWTLSLKNKMQNYRQKLRELGCAELILNRRDASKHTLKRPRRSELNFLPDIPTGFDEEALENERKWMEEEVKKKDVNMRALNTKMDFTFSLRRREVVEDQPLVSTLKQRWPALFNEEQVYAEFRRINHLDLKSTFLTSLDNNSRGLLKLFRAKVIQRGDCDLETLLDNLDEQMADLTVQRRATALRGLPFYFKEHGTICKTILSSEALEHHKVGMKMGILEVVTSNSSTSRSLSDVVNVAIVLEEEVVLENMGDFKVFLNMGTECSKKVQTLMSKLLEN
uniref:Sterile alpha motif domain-containing protein 3-like n=1 Tax=Cyprinus carpio carpio TaxID=630221 RepID=A0A9J8ANK3_CYPCA